MLALGSACGRRESHPRGRGFPDDANFSALGFIGTHWTAAVGQQQAEGPNAELARKIVAHWEGRSAAGGVQLRLEEVAREKGIKEVGRKWKRDGIPLVHFGAMPSEFDYRLLAQRGSYPYSAITYQVHADGSEAGSSYVALIGENEIEASGGLGARRVILVTDSAVVDAEGRVHVGSKSFRFVLYGYAPGESLELALVSRDLAIRAFARAVPFPLEARDRECVVGVEPADREGKFYVIRGAGFVPGEEIRTESLSEGEVVADMARADSAGGFRLVVAPRVVGKKRGRARYSVVGQSCAPTVEYAWGDRANRPQ